MQGKAGLMQMLDNLTVVSLTPFRSAVRRKGALSGWGETGETPCVSAWCPGAGCEWDLKVKRTELRGVPGLDTWRIEFNPNKLCGGTKRYTFGDVRRVLDHFWSPEDVLHMGERLRSDWGQEHRDKWTEMGRNTDLSWLAELRPSRVDLCSDTAGNVAALADLITRGRAQRFATYAETVRGEVCVNGRYSGVDPLLRIYRKWVAKLKSMQDIARIELQTRPKDMVVADLEQFFADDFSFVNWCKLQVADYTYTATDGYDEDAFHAMVKEHGLPYTRKKMGRHRRKRLQFDWRADIEADLELGYRESYYSWGDLDEETAHEHAEGYQNAA